MSYLPEQFVTSLANVPGFDEQAFRQVHEAGRQVTSVRFNPYKLRDNDPSNNLSGRACPAMEMAGGVPWSEHGYYLRERPAFFLDPLWHAGAYYVQEASSMCLEFVLRHTCDLARPLRILDLCAAPGGKSTLIAGMVSRDSILVSNEVIGTRVHILEENLVKYGVSNVVITQNDASDFGRLKGYFDVILVDAPCSGSGLFRKDPEAVKEWSPEQVQLCRKRQERILADVMPALKENGLLIYATCSFSPEEDEQVCDYLVQHFPLGNITIPFEPAWNITETVTEVTRAKGYRFYPDKLDGEGFFLACFKRKEGGKGKYLSSYAKQEKQKRILTTLHKSERQIIAPWIHPADGFVLFSWKNQVWAIPSTISKDLQMLIPGLRIIAAGRKVGKMIRDQLIPDHALAMSIDIAEDVPRMNFSPADAVAYLRKENLEISPVPPGWLLAAYHDHPLGWLKGIQGRFNNYYPTAWRIRKKR